MSEHLREFVAKVRIDYEFMSDAIDKAQAAAEESCDYSDYDELSADYGEQAMTLLGELLADLRCEGI